MTHQSDAVDVRAYEIHQAREAAFEQWWQATSHITRPESREALARMAYHAALAARQDVREAVIEECAKVAKTHAEWAASRIDHENSIFGTVSNTADDIAGMILDLKHKRAVEQNVRSDDE